MSRVHLIVQFLTFDITLPAAQIMEKMVDFKVHHASQFTDTKPIGVCRRSPTRKISCSNGNGRKWSILIRSNSLLRTFSAKSLKPTKSWNLRNDVSRPSDIVWVFSDRLGNVSFRRRCLEVCFPCSWRWWRISSFEEDRSGDRSSPVWSEALFMIDQFPPLVRTMKIALKDHSAVQQDRVIGSFLISESNPAAGFLSTFGPTWMFFDGTPQE